MFHAILFFNAGVGLPNDSFPGIMDLKEENPKSEKMGVSPNSPCYHLLHLSASWLFLCPGPSGPRGQQYCH